MNKNTISTIRRTELANLAGPASSRTDLNLLVEVNPSKREYIGASYVKLIAIAEDHPKFGLLLCVEYNGTEKELSHNFFGRIINQARAAALYNERRETVHGLATENDDYNAQETAQQKSAEADLVALDANESEKTFKAKTVAVKNEFGGWDSEPDNKERDDELASIASSMCHVPTLIERGNDSLDFHDVSVWGLKDALRAAYAAGRKSQTN